MAIENKRQEIRKLQTQLNNIKVIDPDKGNAQLLKNARLLHVQRNQIENKINFMKRSDNTIFKGWPKKRFIADNTAKFDRIISSKKAKKKLKAKSRKARKLQEKLKTRAQFALDNNLVINLTDIVIPIYSVVVLSYGPGWIPSPKFNALQYQVDGHNAVKD